MRSRLRQAEEAMGDVNYVICAVSQMTMNMELVAGNPARAESVGRASCAYLEQRGLTSYLSIDVAYLAEALIAQGKLDEAEAAIARGATLVVPSDIDALYWQARARAGLARARRPRTSRGVGA
jgi:ATP/maltotriose-dependent transcriptional regulator MalT